MNQLQQVEFGMLLELDEICNKLGLQYFLIGGTLLGAVRHKGFIPWDDDIDIGMFRSDYERFISDASKYLPEYIFLQTKESDSKVPFNFAKLRNSNTTFIERAVKKMPINQGIYIDIFPVDYYPDNIVVSKVQDYLLMLIEHRITKELYDFEYNDYSFLGKTANFIVDLLYKDTYHALLDMEKIIKRTKYSRLVKNYCGAWGKKEIVPTDWLSNLIELEFEGRRFPAPIGYDAYLRHVYGDYFSLPPVEKRISHHTTEIIDVNKPYTYYE